MSQHQTTQPDNTDVDTARDLLLELRDSAQKRRDAIEKHLNNRDEPLPAGFAEQAVELENDQAMIAIEEQLDIELSDINAALRRIADGSYGICVDCGLKISASRREALPQATECIGCAEQAESGS